MNKQEPTLKKRTPYKKENEPTGPILRCIGIINELCPTLEFIEVRQVTLHYTSRHVIK